MPEPTLAALRDQLTLAPNRVAAIGMVEAYWVSGKAKSTAVDITAHRLGVSASSIWRWLSHVQGIPKAERLAALADRRCRRQA